MNTMTKAKWLAILVAGSLNMLNLKAQTALSGTGSNLCGANVNATGTTNTMIGCTSGNTTMTGTGNTAVGYSVALALTSGNNNTMLGIGAGASHTSGNANTFVGAASGNLNVIGANNTYLGGAAAKNSNTSENVAIGFKALWTQNGITVSGVPMNSYNVAIGNSALFTNNPTSTANAINNTAVGHNSLYLNDLGTDNTASGYLSGYNNTGSFNSMFGSNALKANTTGTNNTGMGYNAGLANTTGSNNTFIGNQTTASANNYTNGTALGNGASICASNTMMFGNSSVVGWGFGGACPTASNVFVVGTTASNGNGAYLTAGGVWTNASDRDKKVNIKEVEGADILKKINSLSISSWSYKGEINSPKHIGPMAQDFYKIFAVGNDDKSISTIDPAGVALAGIKELSKQTTTQTGQIEDLKKQVAQLTELVKAMSGLNADATTTARQSIQLGNTTAIVLNQNVPNPFAEQTLINYSIPQTAGLAQILFYDIGGRLIKTTDITTRGAGQLTVFANDLNNGSYSYTLIVDGKTIDTKKMIKQQ